MSTEEKNAPRKVLVTQNSSSQNEEVPHEVIVVVSKLKNYIKAKHDMNTSGAVAEKLSDRIRALVDQACVRARSDGRKTLMERDF